MNSNVLPDERSHSKLWVTGSTAEMSDRDQRDTVIWIPYEYFLSYYSSAQ